MTKLKYLLSYKFFILQLCTSYIHASSQIEGIAFPKESIIMAFQLSPRYDKNIRMIEWLLNKEEQGQKKSISPKSLKKSLSLSNLLSLESEQAVQNEFYQAKQQATIEKYQAHFYNVSHDDKPLPIDCDQLTIEI